MYNFIANGGEFADGEIMTSIEANEGEWVDFPTPTRAGYSFTGWYSQSDMSQIPADKQMDYEFKPTAPQAGNWFAAWEKNATQSIEVVSHFVGGDRDGSSETTVVEVPAGSYVSDCVKGEGYTAETIVSGVATSAVEVYMTSSLEGVTTLNVYYKANEQKDQNEANVTFFANGGKFVDGNEYMVGVTASDGTMPQPPAPTREGYTFAGWYWHADYSNYTDEQKEADKVDFSKPVEKGGSMFAQWTRDAGQENLFNVMYVANGGQFFTGEDVQQGVTDSEGVMRQPLAPTREGYTFEGWYWHADYTNYTEEQKALDKVDFTAPIDRDAVMYAQWSKVVIPAEKKITVKFVDNFNKTESTVEINEGEAVAQPKDPSYKGWSFEGWSSTLTDEQGNAKFTPVDFSKVVADEDEDGVVTYYAFYTEDKAEAPAETEKKDEPKQEATEEDASAAEEPAAEAEAAAIPQTGDATNTAAVAGVAGIAGLLAAAAALIRRRFNN